MPRVFVYGSLMKGFHNHRLLEKNEAEFIDPATTTKEYALVSFGGFPGLVYGDKAIAGEVYDVNEKTLEELDHLEGVEQNRYARIRIQTSLGLAFAYLATETTARLGMPYKGTKWIRHPFPRI